MLIFSAALTSFAQSGSDGLTITQIEETAAALNADRSIGAEEKQEAIERLMRARVALELQEKRAAEIAAYQTISQNIDELLLEIGDQQSNLETAPDGSSADLTASAAKSRLALLVAERAALQDALTGLREESVDLAGRGQVIAGEIVSARDTVQRLVEAADAKDSPPDTLVENANWILRQATLMERESAARDLQLELATLPARQSLTAERIMLVEADIAHHERLIEALRGNLSRSALGRAEIKIDKARAALMDLEGGPKELSVFAAETLRLTELLRDGILRSTLLERRIIDQEETVTGLEQSADTVALVLAAGRLSEETATLLLSVRAALPDKAETSAARFQTEKDTGSIRLRYILWHDQLHLMRDVASARKALLIDDANERAGLNDENTDTANSLIEARRALLQQLMENARHEVELLSQYEFALSRAQKVSKQLSSQLDRRLLWLRTSERVNRSWLTQILPGIAWVLSPSGWIDAFKALLSGVKSNPGMAIFFVLVILYLAISRRWQLKLLETRAVNVGHVGRDTYWTTPIAMSATILLSLPLPAATGMLGWLILQSRTDILPFTEALAQAALLLSAVLFVLLLFKEMCRSDGLFERHFNWTDKARLRMQKNLKWFIRLQSGAIFLFALITFSGVTDLRYGLGLLAFVAGSIALAAITVQVLRPKGGIVSQLDVGPTRSMLLKILFPIAVLEPLLVGVLPFFGFFDTAAALQFKVLQSGALMLAGTVIYGLSARVFKVGNRRLALKKAKEKRVRQEAVRAKDPVGTTSPIIEDETIADAELISEQVKSVLGLVAAGSVLFALWAVWHPLMPALGVADDVVLWTRTITENGIDLKTPVTVMDLAFVALVLIGAVYTASNIGGLLEVGLFEPFSFDAGSRYAIASIARYITIAAALLIGLSYLGANWSKLQWIVAAFGVGLGFGLQEIVANFVSGLIILFEQPIRVGDVVTIGELRGKVRSIKIRATSITDFDGRQVILPNKTIITEKVTNWTLDDATTRLLLKVGIAYGSDIETVRQLIFDTVAQHPDVLQSPAPTVFLMRHGDSALEFEIRLFVASPSKRLPITHELNAAINAALKENGFEIPFPQTDVHVSLPEENFTIRIRESDTSSEPPPRALSTVRPE